MGISPHGGSVGRTGVVSYTGHFEIRLQGAWGVECLSLWELCEGNLGGGLIYWELREMDEGVSVDEASLSLSVSL
jgi:hypothetical protein